jgi:hypothetical protein
MLGAEAAKRVRIVALSASVVDGALTLLTLGAVAILWTRRRELRAGLKRRLPAQPKSAAPQDE